MFAESVCGDDTNVSGVQVALGGGDLPDVVAASSTVVYRCLSGPGTRLTVERLVSAVSDI